MPTLFDPLALGALTLPNRILMAPLTRCRAGTRRVPNPLMRTYYAQRASAGLILSEATSVEPMGVGYPGTPGIWSAEQVAGWKQVTSAVHEAGGRMFLQLWHVGRISDPSFLDNEPPVAPSAIAAKGNVSLLRPVRPYPLPRALEAERDPRHRAARSGAARRMPRPPASTASRSMGRTAICWISFSMTAPTIGPTAMAAPSRIARGS